MHRLYPIERHPGHVATLVLTRVQYDNNNEPNQTTQ